LLLTPDCAQWFVKLGWGWTVSLAGKGNNVQSVPSKILVNDNFAE
jgi:hypothetical protein